jgi:hypothetical protein
MTEVLDLDSLSSAEMHNDPYPFALYDAAFQGGMDLDAAFPADFFSWHSQRVLLDALGKQGSDAWFQHNVATRPLLELGETEPFEPDGLSAPWLALARDLSSPEYRYAISELSGHDVRELPMQAHFWCFHDGSSFTPHVDKSHKIVTHLLYLTREWTPVMGGCFRVLGSSNPDDIRQEIPPLPNNAIVLRRTDNAWHSVSGIPRESGYIRRLVQIWFWDDSHSST